MTPPDSGAGSLPEPATATAIGELLERCGPTPAVDKLAALIEAGFDRLPLPGGGQTLDRWRALAAVAAHDLSLVKLYEGHTDALAIRAELGDAPEESWTASWGVWAAEPPHARLYAQSRQDSRYTLRLDGRKAWCSGAASVSHALVTCWQREDGGADRGPLLAAVAMNQPGVRVSDEGWQAVGMAESASVEVSFDGAEARLVGELGAYVNRPGFWHGGAGIAACWYGATAVLAEPLRQRIAQRPEPHAAAHLGAVDMALSRTAALLRETAAEIDRRPAAYSQLIALRARAAAERTAGFVLDHVGRALGAAPFCQHGDFARRAADLPVFIRQCHAERDLQTLGELLAAPREAPWTL